MIGFSLFGHYGRLGNQLYQYAYLRTKDIELGTRLYCLDWDGDEFFEIKDEEIRAIAPPASREA